MLGKCEFFLVLKGMNRRGYTAHALNKCAGCTGGTYGHYGRSPEESAPSVPIALVFSRVPGSAGWLWFSQNLDFSGSMGENTVSEFLL